MQQTNKQNVKKEGRSTFNGLSPTLCFRKRSILDIFFLVGGGGGEVIFIAIWAGFPK